MRIITRLRTMRDTAKSELAHLDHLIAYALASTPPNTHGAKLVQQERASKARLIAVLNWALGRTDNQ